MLDPEKKLTYELTFQDVLKILQMVDEAAAYQELKIELDDLKLHLVTRGNGAAKAVSAQGAATAPAQAAAIPAQTPAAVAAPAVAQVATAQMPQSPAAATPFPANAVGVQAPVGGIFYRCPAPGEPPFTEVGQPVQVGATVGLVEVMKLFTPVKSPVDGIVREIRARNEELVMSGQLLVVIAP